MTLEELHPVLASEVAEVEVVDEVVKEEVEEESQEVMEEDFPLDNQ